MNAIGFKLGPNPRRRTGASCEDNLARRGIGCLLPCRVLRTRDTRSDSPVYPCPLPQIGDGGSLGLPLANLGDEASMKRESLVSTSSRAETQVVVGR